jgi:hypothetical protein
LSSTNEKSALRRLQIYPYNLSVFGTEKFRKKGTKSMGRHKSSEDILKRIDVWLNERHMETIEHAKKIHGGTAATAIRAGLELLRRQMKLDQ